MGESQGHASFWLVYAYLLPGTDLGSTVWQAADGPLQTTVFARVMRDCAGERDKRVPGVHILVVSKDAFVPPFLLWEVPPLLSSPF